MQQPKASVPPKHSSYSLGKIRPRELIVIALLLLVGIVFLVAVRYLGQREGAIQVILTRQGEILYQGPISEDITFISPYNPQLIVQVSQGRARFLQSDCPDQVCVSTGWLTEHGDTAACLPNRTILRLEAERPAEDSPDSIT